MMSHLSLRLGLLIGLLSGSSGWADDQRDAPLAQKGQTVPVLLDLDSIRAIVSKGSASKTPDSNDPEKYRPYKDLIDKATKHDGFLTLFEKEEHLYAEIKPGQFDQPMLSPITIARGLAMAGNPLNFGDEWILMFHRAGDKVQLIRRNVTVKAPEGTPIEKAVKQNYTDSILLALPIVALNQGQSSVVIDLADIYLTNFADLPMGSLDRNRTTWSKVKTYADNIELEVQATFGGSMYGYGSYMGGDGGVVDSRGITVVIHYSLVKMPDSKYQPRLADDRVGHFLNATKDFGKTDPDGNILRMINRWRLEKADPKAKLSAPKKQIVWYIEDTVPLEYRSAVEDGIREWNKAFEKIGFRDAITVRWQEPGRDEFDPEDINYCTFRWITTSSTYAMSCLRSNPITGEMIDGDVIFDASWVRYWKNEYAVLTGEPPVAAGQGANGGRSQPLERLGMGEVISTTLAAKRGYGQTPLLVQPIGSPTKLSLAPAEWSGLHRALLKRMSNSERSSCRFAVGMRTEIGLAAMVMEEAVKENPESKLPEDFLNQLIKEVIMHEVGHSLGLRHNFKASTMLDADQLNNTEITHVKGLTGSVMDYNPINIVPKGQKQGDFMTTTIGPYDYWAIEYAYKEIKGDEADELKKVAARAPEHDLVFGTDSDMSNADPLVNVYDLGSDVSRFAQDRITLASQLLKNLDDKVVKDGESFARTKTAFSYLMGQYGNAADLVASYVGGQSIARNHKGDKDAVDPITPISGEKQRASLAFLAANVWDDSAFHFSPKLLRRLADEHWDMGVGSTYSFGSSGNSINDRVLSIQKIALGHCLSGSVLSRLQQQELMAEPDGKPLAVAEVFATITGTVFREIGLDPSKPLETSKPTTLGCSTIRRNLQREYFRRLATIVLGEQRPSTGDYFLFIFFGDGGTYPADARSLARFHLKKIGDQIGKVLDTKEISLDDTCRAHFEELRQNITKTLNAEQTVNQP